jgi:hypothetical protein
MPDDPINTSRPPSRTWVALAAALLLTGFIFALPFVPAPQPPDTGYALELNLASNYDAVVQVFWDTGAGINAANNVSVPVQKSDTPIPLRFVLPTGRYRQIRFDPINHPGRAAFSEGRIVDAEGRVLRRLPLEAFVPTKDIAALRIADGLVQFRADGGDPNFVVALDGLDLPLQPDHSWRRAAAVVLVAISVVLAVGGLFFGLVFSPLTGLRPWARSQLARWAARPVGSLALVALFAALLSCYPLVFLGKSLVSPNFGPLWLYSTQPTVPGSTESHVTSANGSDVGALFWFSVPFTSVEHRALFEAGELPLWNRYNDSGNPLLAQGQSMLGDPLQFITICADSAAWAWDLRFIIARFLLAFGTGLCIWRITGRRLPALLLALSAPFIGFFLYRVNHPAAFGLCYGPWILFAWILLAQGPFGRNLVAPLGLWLLANWCVLNSGTVKEAYFIGLGLNITGVLLLFFTAMPSAERWKKFGLMAVASAGFVLLAAPVWLNFLDCLRHSATAYDNPYALQIPPGLLPGFFDDIFYRAANPQELPVNPAVNLFVAIGLLWCVITPRETLANPAGRALGLTGLLCGLLVFGVIPPAWVTAVPFLGNVGHLSNTFSCVLVVVALVLAGLGWSRSIDWLAGRRNPGEIGLVILVAALLAANYLGAGQAQFDLTKPRLLNFSPFFHRYVASLLLACAGLLAGAHVALRRRWWTPAAWVVVICCWVMLHWRMGLQAPLRDEQYVICPPARADFHAPSPSMTWLQTRVAGETPARVAGFQLNLVSGVSGFYGLEGISGSDPLTNGNYQALSQAAGLSRRNEWAWQFGPEDWRRNHAFYDLLNVRYFLTREEVPADITGLEQIREGDLNIYRSPTAWPRAFFTDQVASYAALPDFVDQVRNGDGRPFASVPPAELPQWSQLAVGKITPARSVVAGRDYHLGFNYTEFTVNNDRPGAAVLMETDRDGDFSATCDGQRVPHFRVDHAFKAVRLDTPGPHRIRFTYRPHFWYLSLGLAAGGAGTLGAAFWGLRRRKTNEAVT